MDDVPDTRRPAVEVLDEQDVAVPFDLVRGAAARALDALGIPEDASLHVTLVDVDRIAELKEQALGTRAATDVLSFPVDDPDDPSPGPLVLGDLVLCPAVAASQARALGRTLEREIAELVVHGVLHVCGRDHATPRDELAMAAEQRGIVASIGGAR